MTEEEWVDNYCQDFYNRQREHAELMHHGSVCMLTGRPEEFIDLLYQRSLAQVNKHGDQQQGNPEAS